MSPPASPRVTDESAPSSPPMFDDEDIGVHSYSYRPSQPSSTSAPPPSHHRTSLPSSLPSHSRLPPSSSSSHSDPIDISDDDIDSDPTPTPSSQPRPVILPLRTGEERRGKGRRSKRRDPIPHSPHCSVVNTNLNRPFQCIYPDRLGERRRVDDEKSGDGRRCNADFSSRQACENHIRARHTKERLPCSYGGCVFSSTDFQKLTKHEREVHKNAA